MTTVRDIIRDKFRPIRADGHRSLSRDSIGSAIVLPLIGAALLYLACPKLPSVFVAIGLAIFAIVAAVLTGLLAVIQNIVGMTKVSRRYTRGDRLLYERESRRLAVLRELYASVAYTVIMLTLSLGPLAILAYSELGFWIASTLTFIVYFSAINMAIAFLQIVTGVYTVLDHQADELSQRLRANAPNEDRSPPDHSNDSH